MNWLAWDPRPFLGAALGAAVGAGVYRALLPSPEAPWAVGLGLGLGAFLTARDRSLLRGWVLGALALWASALAQATWQGDAATSWWSRVGAFHASLSLERLALHALGALLAGWLSARSIRAGSPKRVAGA